MKTLGIFAAGLGIGMVVGWASRWRRDVKLLESHAAGGSETALAMRPGQSAIEFDRRLRSYF